MSLEGSRFRDVSYDDFMIRKVAAVGAVTARLIAVMVLLVICFRGAPARADSVTTLIKQLEDSSDRVRLQAATSLSRIADKRAILPFIKRLDPNVESEALVRQAAASALGSLVNASTSSSIRGLAVKALQKAASGDPDRTVKVNANASLKQLGAGGSDAGGGPSTASGRGGIYVNIGPMSAKTGSEDDPKFREMMVKVATKTLGRSASNMTQTWPGGGSPPSSQAAAKKLLEGKQIAGFYVDGTLNVLDTKTSGGNATISCKVSMLLASYPDKSVFGLLNGGAKVQSSDRPRDMQLAREDCISAVIEDLIASKIVPTIKTKVSP